jgi:hypothetical protein
MRYMIVLAAAFAATPALAGYDSAYTDFDLGACEVIQPAPAPGEGEGSATYECQGHAGIPVTFAEGDLRAFVAFGESGAKHCAFRQTFGGFNNVSNKIEWRLKDGAAIATIFRWSVSYDSEDSNKQKTWLVVTKLDGNNSCQMGYVEGAYPQANEKARWLADTAAEAYSCAKGIPIFFANPGTATDGIASSGPCEP